MPCRTVTTVAVIFKQLSKRQGIAESEAEHSRVTSEGRISSESEAKLALETRTPKTRLTNVCNTDPVFDLGAQCKRLKHEPLKRV